MLCSHDYYPKIIIANIESDAGTDWSKYLFTYLNFGMELVTPYLANSSCKIEQEFDGSLDSLCDTSY